MVEPKLTSMKAIMAEAKFLRLVNGVANQTLGRCEALLRPLKHYVVSISPAIDPFVSKRMLGATGFTYNMQRMNVMVDVGVSTWRRALEGSIAHEFNHIIRMQYLGIRSSYGYSLADAVTSEGLAMLFAEEMTGNRFPYTAKMSQRRMREVWEKMHVYKKGDYYNRFFTNAWDKTYPLWCGYAVSYEIIKRRKEELLLSTTYV